MSLPRPRLALSLAVALACGCRQPTEVVVEVVTDVPCATVSMRGTSLTVGPASELEARSPLTTTTACQQGVDAGTVGTIVIVPAAGNRDAFDVRVVTGVRTNADDCVAPGYAGCIVARRALSFLPHTPLHLRIDMRQDCVDQPCDPASTCLSGQCVPSAVDPSRCTSSCGTEALDGGGDRAAEAGGGEAGGDGAADAGADGPADAGGEGCAPPGFHVNCIQSTPGPSCKLTTGQTVPVTCMPMNACCVFSAQAVCTTDSTCNGATTPFYPFSCDEPDDCPGNAVCAATAVLGASGGALCLAPTLVCGRPILCQDPCQCDANQQCQLVTCTLTGAGGMSLQVPMQTCGGVCPM